MSETTAIMDCCPSSSSPIRVRFLDMTNSNGLMINNCAKKKIHLNDMDDDRRWKLLGGATAITIASSDENENDAWTECPEAHRTHMLNLSSATDSHSGAEGCNNYLLRHSSANTSLNESTSLEVLAGGCASIDDNHDDILLIIEHAGITSIDRLGFDRSARNYFLSVHIYDATSGRLWGQCDLRDHLSFPTSVCVNVRHELYVRDNESHFVRVFDYTGKHLKNIGTSITYPIPCGSDPNYC